VFVDRTSAVGRSMRSALSTALLIIGAIAVCNWVAWPYVGYLHAVQQLEPVVGQMAEEKDRIHGNLDTKLLQARAMERELADIRAGLFRGAEVAEFFRNLPMLVEQTGCLIVLADFTDGDAGPARRGDKPDALEASHANLTVLGQYEQLIALLERLQNDRRKVWVDSCRVERYDAGRGLCRCQLAVTIYALAEGGDFVDE
jgi:hypothetical protein